MEPATTPVPSFTAGGAVTAYSNGADRSQLPLPPSRPRCHRVNRRLWPDSGGDDKPAGASEKAATLPSRCAGCGAHDRRRRRRPPPSVSQPAVLAASSLSTRRRRKVCSRRSPVRID
ncbi:hypothetical protein ACHAWF_018481 [Thalassiosira exigua]